VKFISFHIIKYEKDVMFVGIQIIVLVQDNIYREISSPSREKEQKNQKNQMEKKRT